MELKIICILDYINYRESIKVISFVCNGILFNHESPRRGETFVKPTSGKVLVDDEDINNNLNDYQNQKEICLKMVMFD